MLDTARKLRDNAFGGSTPLSERQGAPLHRGNHGEVRLKSGGACRHVGDKNVSDHFDRCLRTVACDCPGTDLKAAGPG